MNPQREDNALAQVVNQSGLSGRSGGGACGNGCRRVGGLGKERRWRSEACGWEPAVGPGAERPLECPLLLLVGARKNIFFGFQVLLYILRRKQKSELRIWQVFCVVSWSR
ncbi:PREDICTED: uncharacterized protein LOC101378638 [Odobenus rosmarus divergens]|uniref:Uncharacterized protein LOC101378638 n=1 Tax=Odobenus rosmarus divergens TaxID=9708 RepID=A0A9B0GJD8_ODORO